MIISLMPVAGRSATEAAERAMHYLRGHGIAISGVADVNEVGTGRYQVDLEANTLLDDAPTYPAAVELPER